MKRIIICLMLSISSLSYAQNIEFSPETREFFDQLVQNGIDNGLSKKDAMRAALENDEYKKKSYKDLANSNKDLNKKGIMLSKDFSRIVLHENVAIVPFVTTLKDNATKKQSKKKNIKKEEILSETAQEYLYDYLMKNQFNYSVKFQDINRTNQLLKSSGILSTLSSTTDEQLAKILGVDAIIRGSFEQTIEKRSALDLAQRYGVVPNVSGSKKPFDFSTRETTGTLKLSIGDGETGDALWRIETDKMEGGKDADNIIDGLMNNIAIYFPYSVEFSK